MSRFLESWRTYMEKTTDTPSEFIEASGLACLSGIAMGRRYIARGAEIRPNLFMMLVAGSSRDRKSYSIEKTTDILRDVEPERVGPDDFTAEALATRMAVSTKPGVTARSIQYIGIEEFGVYLAQAASYNTTSNAILCKLYDGSSFERARQGITKNIFVDKPRLTIFAACAFAMFERYADPKDWNTGFYARFLFVPGITRRPKNDIQPAAAPFEAELTRANLSDLRDALGLNQAVAVLPQAEDVFREYAREFGEESSDAAEQASRERLLNTTWKLGLLYQLDIDPAHPIGPEAMVQACAFSRMAWQGFQLAYRQTAGDEFSRTMRKVWDDVDTAGPEGIKRTALLRKHHLSARILDQIVKLLISYAAIWARKVPTGGNGRGRSSYAECFVSAKFSSDMHLRVVQEE